MKRLASWLAVSLLLCPTASRAGDESGSMCQRDEVVEFVTRLVHQQNVYAKLDETSIGEIPTSTPNEVLCVISLVNKNYDYRAYSVARWQGYQEYIVRKLDHGYEVSLRP